MRERKKQEVDDTSSSSSSDTTTIMLTNSSSSEESSFSREEEEEEEGETCRSKTSSWTSKRYFVLVLLCIAVMLTAQLGEFPRKAPLMVDVANRSSTELEYPVLNASHVNESQTFFKRIDGPPPGVSPYEWREGHTPSHWARKTKFFRGNDIPRNKSVCFVHVGKAAGSSVGCALGFQLHCKDQTTYPRGLLPVYTTNTIHRDVNDCSDDMGYYMFTLRDPVERLKSWFAYEKPSGPVGRYTKYANRGKLFRDCRFFRTLNDLAELGLGPERPPGGRLRGYYNVCRHRAQMAITGKQQFGDHAFYNYRYYLDAVCHNASVIAAVRQEHIVDDWNSMEALLGGTDRIQRLPTKNKHKKDLADDYLSPKAREFLCQSICHEILVYKSILYRAANLRASDVEESIQELRKSCPAQADLTTCPDG